ncbi:MAG: integrin alpha, partial [Myxococcota bacterium]
VGATEDDDGASGGGAVHLLTTLGSGDEDLGSATSKLVAAGAGDDFGYAVAGAGDVDGDGLDDVLVGARFQDGVGSQSGAAYLFVAPRSGTVSASAATATLLGEAASDLAGEGLAGGEDLDGDGLSDLVVGASGAGSYGRVYVFHGPVTGTVSLSAADARIDGSYLLEQLGEAIALLPDLAGDGYPDLLLGSEHAADEGAAYVFAGPLSASATTADAHATFLGDGTANFDVGSSVASAGDVDGDEVTDVLVGDRRATGVAVQHGAVYLFYGPHAGARPVEDAEMVFAGEGTGDYAGSAVAAGDVDADGVPDLVIGATGRYGGGAAYLVYGP